MAETILAIGAHNDDHVIGAGGALTKYAKEGRRVRTIICSFGEKSHPHLKKEVIIRRRVQESLKADKVMGCSGIVYLGVREGHFDEEFATRDIARKIAWLIRKENPSKIFTHGIDDFHPDHQAVHRLVMRLAKEGKIKCPIYSFEIWSLVKLRNRNLPRLVVDISKELNTKIRAFLVHESQTATIWALLWKLILKDKLSGLIHGYRYAEVFYRLK
ncbi:MAG: PIG-L deacetylase family protein [Candidatus Woesearchaeota archaeon]